MPPENSAPVNNTIPLENRAALKSPPSKTTPVMLRFRPCQVAVASLQAFGVHDLACLVATPVFLVLAVAVVLAVGFLDRRSAARDRSAVPAGASWAKSSAFDG